MNKLAIILTMLALCGTAEASWYWPFGGEKPKAKMRVSELIEPVSVLIDEATEFADAGKIDEAVEAYRKALAELDRIEAENADRAQSATFATIRNKRAYVSAAIDSLLFRQATQNARAVSVTDTTELEKKLAALKGAGAAQSGGESAGQDGAAPAPGAAPAGGESAEESGGVIDLAEASAERRAKLDEEFQKTPESRSVRLRLAAECLKSGDTARAKALVDGILAERPGDFSALNLRAAVEMETGDIDKAEATLAESIKSNPKSYYAYYNMARLILARGGGELDRAAARDYYETGRGLGGPVDKALEGRL